MDIKRDVSLRPLLALAAQLALTGCLTGNGPDAQGIDPQLGSNVAAEATSRDKLDFAPGIETQTRSYGSLPAGSAQGASPPVATTYPGGSPLGPPSTQVKFDAHGKVAIDLEDADIATAAKAVLGDVLKADYSIDPRISGKVTIKTGKPLPAKQALSILENALTQNGVALIENDGAYTLVPLTEAGAASPIPIRSADDDQDGPGFGMRAVALKHISAAEMADILAPIDKNLVERIDKERNSLVLRGSGAQFNAAMETIRTFDVDWLSNKSVGVFPLTNASSDNVTKALTSLLQNDNIDSSLARFITLDSNNTVIAVAKTPQILASIRRWVARLDQASGSTQRIFTYEMRYTSAAEAGQIVGAALGITPTLVGGASSSSAHATDATGSSAQSAPTAPVTNGATGAAGATSPATLDPARAALDQAVKKSDAGAPTAGETASSARLVIDSVNNKLLLYGSQDQFEKLQSALRTIDRPQKQVLVEASFIEVELTNDLQYGVQYYLNKMAKGIAFQGQLTANASGQVAPISPGGSLTIGLNPQAIINTLSSLTTVNVISSPNLMVKNNQPARLVVGDQVPVSTQSTSNLLNTGGISVTAISMVDTGIIFDVTPHITASGAVTLDILQEVSSVKTANGASANSLTPTISQRRVTSTVVAENNETVVIGGLFSRNRQRSRSGLPGLISMPVIGGIFGDTENTDDKTELIVLISPKIINDRGDARNVTRELSDRVTDLRLIDTRARRVLSAPVPARSCDPATKCVSEKY